MYITLCKRGGYGIKIYLDWVEFDGEGGAGSDSYFENV